MQVSPAASSCNSPSPDAHGIFTQNYHAAGAYYEWKRHSRSSPTLVDLTNEEVGEDQALAFEANGEHYKGWNLSELGESGVVL
jgi:hypothetical protein